MLSQSSCSAPHFLPTVTVVRNIDQDPVTDQTQCIEKMTGFQVEHTEGPRLLLEWFAENCHAFGAGLELVTNRSQEGAQFCKGFGGIGGLLRYKVDFVTHEEEFYSDEEEI